MALLTGKTVLETFYAKKRNEINWSGLFSHFLTSLSTSNSILTSHLNLNGEQNPMIHNSPDSRGDFIDCWIDTSNDIRFIVQLFFAVSRLELWCWKLMQSFSFTSFWTHNKSCQIPLNSFKHGFWPKAPLSSYDGLQVHLRSVDKLQDMEHFDYSSIKKLWPVESRGTGANASPTTTQQQRRKHLHI